MTHSTEHGKRNTPPVGSKTPISRSDALWKWLTHGGGLDLRLYDGQIDLQIRHELGLDSAKSLSSALEERDIDLETFVPALLRALHPWSQMFSQLLGLFEKMGARRGIDNLTLKFDFGKSGDSLEFDLRSFREIVEHWRRFLRPIEVWHWKGRALWSLRGRLGEPWAVPPENQKYSRWAEEYEAGAWPEDELPPPKSGVPDFDAAVEQAWVIWHAYVEAARRIGPTRGALGEYQGSSSDWEMVLVEGTIQDSPSLRAFLRGLDSDRWALSFAHSAYSTAEELARSEDPEKSTRASRIAQGIREELDSAPAERREMAQLLREIEELLSLPVWRRRPELFSIWVLTRIVQALGGPTELDFHIHSETFAISFSGTHVATAGDLVPRLMVWAELRSPLEKPQGKGRTGGIQPDYSIVIEPYGDNRSTIVAVECKQYLRPSRRIFVDALTDYARGRPRAQVILVDYGPAKEDLLTGVPMELRPRTVIIGDFRPGAEHSLDQFDSLMKQVVASNCSPLATRGPETAPSTLVPVQISVTWGESPRDLDLHLRLPEDTGGTKVFHSFKGSLEDEPWACLDRDVRDGRGPETIRISKAKQGRYRVGVHNYSAEGPLAGCHARLDIAVGNVSVQMECPQAGEGRWWHVLDIDVSNRQINVINEINDMEV